MDSAKKQNDKFSYIKTLLSLVLLFAGCFCVSPTSEILRTLPLIFLCGVACAFLKTKPGFACSFTILVCLSLNLVLGMGVAESAFFAALATLFAYLGMSTFKFLSLAKRTKIEGVKTKCIVLSLLSAAVCLVLSIMCMGNPISFYNNNRDNERYIEKSYGANAEKDYTIYDAKSGEYRTYLELSDKDDQGKTLIFNDLYVCRKDGVLTDKVRDYYEEKILDKAVKYMGNAIMGKTEGFNIIGSDIAFPEGELVFSGDNYEKYLERVDFVALFDAVIKDGEKAQFTLKCEKALELLKSNGIKYNKLLLCAGDGEGIVYSCMINSGEAEVSVEIYNESLLSDFCVSEQEILDYWQNN